jgi:hypothetical protein
MNYRQYTCRSIHCCLAIIGGFTFASVAMGSAISKNLQTLTIEASAQIELAYRQHPLERELRRQQLAEVVKSWRAAERDQSNNELLANWLRAAIVNSMPGSQDPLPPVPAFISAAKVHEPEIAIEPVLKTQPVADTKTESDPFRDDPVNASK